MLGYCTKYGDNAADLQPLLHLYKTEIYEYAKELGIYGIDNEKGAFRRSVGRTERRRRDRPFL